LLIRRKALLLAGAGSCIMAAIHFFLPLAYGWTQYRDLVPPGTYRLLAGITFGFSFILMWGGCMSILTASRPTISRLQYMILYGQGVLWAAYLVYEARFPPPVPPSLQKMLMAGAAIITLLYMVFLFSRRRTRSGNMHEKT
jgi:hypothetical protein